MLRSKYFLAAALLLTVAAPKLASGKDLLPLERGIFVDTDVPCNQRSNASVVSYWGDALNTSPVECKIKKLKVDGLIPSPIAQNPCAQSRKPIDMMVQG
jgi:hypothetical protein